MKCDARQQQTYTGTHSADPPLSQETVRTAVRRWTAQQHVMDSSAHLPAKPLARTAVHLASKCLHSITYKASFPVSCNAKIDSPKRASRQEPPTGNFFTLLARSETAAMTTREKTCTDPPETATSLRKALGIRLKLDQLLRTKDDWHHSGDQEQRVHTGDVSRSSSEVWNGGDTIHYERKEGRLMNFAGTAYIHSPL